MGVERSMDVTCKKECSLHPLTVSLLHEIHVSAIHNVQDKLLFFSPSLLAFWLISDHAVERSDRTPAGAWSTKKGAGGRWEDSRYGNM